MIEGIFTNHDVRALLAARVATNHERRELVAKARNPVNLVKFTTRIKLIPETEMSCASVTYQCTWQVPSLWTQLPEGGTRMQMSSEDR
ncbi:MAG: hypothetical protein CO030_03505 [Candidatus Magasanikbacteria bacterium CG_4_9_14_0_2_um_filter_42_11]|uniref:Uncharacterized protein n=1 Tax=Candidatus Magasanikbacteria bacterium CG_4_9_14_0_2_um_filter_42_11 TaxID=1974643 RepID=A0A2M8F9E3_9BACT|nr:MAG: hypothetical protein COU34_02805 [Candidatus Magasanikbacteria bacterium CG10_big_fil_rev_8_21_14_0_10_43_9]PJC52326.1 MAG: hypothetical protein CO030_03505 [Candidatus Magasanikbacteria bacterium CG_4_9_14_0_2_um_filter_42_11]